MLNIRHLFNTVRDSMSLTLGRKPKPTAYPVGGTNGFYAMQLNKKGYSKLVKRDTSGPYRPTIGQPDLRTMPIKGMRYPEKRRGRRMTEAFKELQANIQSLKGETK